MPDFTNFDAFQGAGADFNPNTLFDEFASITPDLDIQLLAFDAVLRMAPTPVYNPSTFPALPAPFPPYFPNANRPCNGMQVASIPPPYQYPDPTNYTSLEIQYNRDASYANRIDATRWQYPPLEYSNWLDNAQLLPPMSESPSEPQVTAPTTPYDLEPAGGKVKKTKAKRAPRGSAYKVKIHNTQLTMPTYMPHPLPDTALDVLVKYDLTDIRTCLKTTLLDISAPCNGGCGEIVTQMDCRPHLHSEIHLSDAVPRCVTCAKTFTTHSVLAKHIEDAHFHQHVKCPFCDKRQTRVANMGRHFENCRSLAMYRNEKA